MKCDARELWLPCSWGALSSTAEQLAFLRAPQGTHLLTEEPEWLQLNPNASRPWGWESLRTFPGPGHAMTPNRINFCRFGVQNLGIPLCGRGRICQEARVPGK